MGKTHTPIFFYDSRIMIGEVVEASAARMFNMEGKTIGDLPPGKLEHVEETGEFYYEWGTYPEHQFILFKEGR